MRHPKLSCNRPQPSADSTLRLARRTVSVCWLGLCLAPSAPAFSSNADAIHFGRPIVTVDDKNPSAEALGRQGRKDCRRRLACGDRDRAEGTKDADGRSGRQDDDPGVHRCARPCRRSECRRWRPTYCHHDGCVSSIAELQEQLRNGRRVRTSRATSVWSSASAMTIRNSRNSVTRPLKISMPSPRNCR